MCARQTLAQVEVQGHFVGGLLFLAGGLLLHGQQLALGVLAQAGHVAFGRHHLLFGPFDERFPVGDHAALELDGVVDLVHELALVEQLLRVHTGGAAARGPALVGFLRIGLQLLQLVVGDLQLALLLGQGGAGVVSPPFGNVHHLVQGLEIAHGSGSPGCFGRSHQTAVS